MFFKTTPILLAASALAISACSAQTSTQAVAEADHHASTYVKPGAALEMTHDYDGQSDAFSGENFTISITDGYDAGTLTVILNGSDALNFFSATEYTFNLAGDGVHTIPVDISAREDGRYYLNVIMHANLGNDEVQSFVNSIAIPVGTGDAIAFTPETTATITPDGTSIIDMEAQETIITGE